MISKKLAKEILEIGLSTGADFAEIYLENSFNKVTTVENGKVDNISAGTTAGAGIRLLQGTKSVYGFTNKLDRKNLSILASNLASSLKGSKEYEVKDFKTKKVKNISKNEHPLKDASEEEIIQILKKSDSVMANFDKRIVRRQSVIILNSKNVELFNSKGLHFKDSKERGRFVASAIALSEGKIETAFSGPGAQRGFDFFIKEINVEEVALKTAKAAIKQLSAKECPSGEMPVVVGNGWGGVLFHEACGHPLEGTSVSKGLSVFSNSLGKQIASPLVSAVDDGTIPGEWGSNNIDDEGNPTQKNVLIKDGVCVNFLLDDFTGRRINKKGNGACRRQSYKYEPTSRMSNTYICNGKSSPEEIIKATKLGLYVVDFGGGQVNPATGEFNFGASEAYIIRNGKVCEAVRGATLIGKGEEILKNIDMVGNDLKFAQGNCGSASGSIPVDVGQPTLRISHITVGGTGGELKWITKDYLN